MQIGGKAILITSWKETLCFVELDKKEQHKGRNRSTEQWGPFAFLPCSVFSRFCGFWLALRLAGWFNRFFFFLNLLTRKLQTSNKPSIESQLGPKEGATRVCVKTQLYEEAAKIHVLVILFSNASCCSPASPVSPDSNRTLARQARRGATRGRGRRSGLNLGHC